MTIETIAKLLTNLWFNKNLFSLQKISLMGEIFTVISLKGTNVWIEILTMMSLKGTNVWMVSDLMKSWFWKSSQAQHACREQYEMWE